jgi:hypothetical protein
MEQLAIAKLSSRSMDELLVDLSDLYPRQSTYDKWPRNVEYTRDPLSGALEMAMEIIEKQSLALWPTDVGYLTARDGLLAKGDESTALRDALREAEAPVVYVGYNTVHSNFPCSASSLSEVIMLSPFSFLLHLISFVNRECLTACSELRCDSCLRDIISILKLHARQPNQGNSLS